MTITLTADERLILETCIHRTDVGRWASFRDWRLIARGLWYRGYLRKNGRGQYQITDAGREAFRLTGC